MMVDLRQPPINGTDKEMRSYIYQLRNQLQIALNDLDSQIQKKNDPILINNSCDIRVVSKGEKEINGENGGILWYYRKWSDGTAECWGMVKSTATFSTLSGSLYLSTPLPSFDYPIQFEDPPLETVTMRCKLSPCISVASGLNSEIRTGQYTPASPIQGTGNILYANYYVFGSFKK